MTSTSELSDFESAYLQRWAEIHKRSGLVHLILRALREGEKWSGELTGYIDGATSGEWGVDERSLYRALRRLDTQGFIEHSASDAAGTGAKRKVFALTDSGARVLAEYERATVAYLSPNPENGAKAVR